MSSSSPILIIGAGVLGLATAAELARRGHGVTVVDPGDVNASAVAAGMIAPAMESALENAAPERADLLRAARDLWPDFAQAVGVAVLREGAEWRGPDVPDMARRLKDLGFAVSVENEALFTPEDWRIQPVMALAAMREMKGVALTSGRVQALEAEGPGWRIRLAGGGDLRAEQVVLATGAAASIERLPAFALRILELIRPIRGQIERIEGASLVHVMRGEGAYAAPADGGAVVGATMDFDRDDLTPDPAQTDRLLRAASRFCDLPSTAGRTLVGVRGASPDGLPIAGALGPGLFAALAPRRNGWLLAPAVAAVTADAILGEPKTALAAVFDPARF